MHAKIHNKRYPDGSSRTVIAACDAHLLGKVLQGEGENILDLKTYRSFYGEKVSAERLLEMLEGAQNLNLVGEKVIGIAAKVLPVDPKKAKMIGGVPHVQVYRV